jgi:hypothetical protein
MLDVAYTDVAGNNLVVARIKATVVTLIPGHLSFRVHQVAYLRGDPLTEFTTTRIGPPE